MSTICRAEAETVLAAFGAREARENATCVRLTAGELGLATDGMRDVLAKKRQRCEDTIRG